ncbi:type II toxin-antitoxin system RelE family toxin [Thermococcus peptonophilus]|uniref:Addiction module toxin RelE n=1 Tax=Thermococcus peptonophilus TaxID=53952 RepID=A0A142CSG8_9EURY|nr:type II toxin-antitoxin system RelE/ParE family toxin [Thermococcus peptonophilus]AMQ17720.1 addiction module toxin RelE [Thermococcus peptonophilus]
MSYELILSGKSEKALKKAPPEDRKRIVSALFKLKENPWAMQYKKLRGHPFYRVRVGDWRIIYTVDDEAKIVYVVRLGKREGVYDNL